LDEQSDGEANSKPKEYPDDVGDEYDGADIDGE
jgi:hypothetical protein